MLVVRFERVMFSAQTFQVGRMRRTTRIVGNGVVDVAHVGRPVAIGEAAGEVAATHEIGQRR